MSLDRKDLTLNSTERKLLWGIYETLQEIRDLLKVPATREQTAEAEPPAEEEPFVGFTCKVCGQTYENKGAFLACARKHKKEERGGT
jgi:hypothetical protein